MYDVLVIGAGQAGLADRLLSSTVGVNLFNR